MYSKLLISSSSTPFRFVLAAYALAFMVILPLVVGMWWYKSIRYTGEKILLDTTQLYFYFFHKTPNMVMRRVIMILGASLEFSKMHNQEIFCAALRCLRSTAGVMPKKLL